METIYTIGYGSRSVKDFLQILKKHDIQYLVDVRSVPYSRYNPSFTKNQLHAILKEHDISYLFLGEELGGRPNDEDCYLPDGRVNYDAIVDKEFYKEGIKRLQNASEGGYKVALMCSEQKPHECHRSKLISRTLESMSIPVQHIDEQGILKTQEEVIELFLQVSGANQPKQHTLWETESTEPIFTSRKIYHPSKSNLKDES